MAEVNLFQKLRRLFSSDVVVRSVGGKKLKVIDVDRLQSLGFRTNYQIDRYARVMHPGSYSYNAQISFQTSRLQLYNDYEVMDADPIIACLSGDTKVSTLEGFMSIEDLSKKYSNGEYFEVWSWDKDACQYTIGQAHHPRKTGTKKVIEVVCDNGKSLKCTEDHRILLVDGTYKQLP